MSSVNPVGAGVGLVGGALFHPNVPGPNSFHHLVDSIHRIRSMTYNAGDIGMEEGAADRGQHRRRPGFD